MTFNSNRLNKQKRKKKQTKKKIEKNYPDNELTLKKKKYPEAKLDQN